MEGFMVEPEIFTHRRRRGSNCRSYLVRHPKMTSVKFGKAKVQIETEPTGQSDAEKDYHIDTPRPPVIFSNQELVDANLAKAQSITYTL